MNKKIARESIKSITLIELLVSIVILSIMVLIIYGIYTFSHSQVLNADRRTKVQNELTYALEHMSKYVQQANGDTNNPPIKVYPNPPETQTGFQVRVDFNNPQTPSSLADDAWISYYLSGNILTAACSGTGCPFVSEALSNRVIANFIDGIMPNSPTDGFYVKIDSSGSLVDIGLVGRYKPTEDTSLATRFTNPQVEIKTKIICNNSSTN